MKWLWFIQPSGEGIASWLADSLNGNEIHYRILTEQLYFATIFVANLNL